MKEVQINNCSSMLRLSNGYTVINFIKVETYAAFTHAGLTTWNRIKNLN